MSETDRELLELAAKAAGYDEIAFEEPNNGYYPFCYDAEGDVVSWWNPLEDDGDALRLAVKVRAPCLAASLRSYAPLEPEGADPYAATRRAIVRAAAEVGKGMLSEAEFILMFPGRFDDEAVARAAAEIGRSME